MRIALISDIHGNLVALETVLHELDHEPIDSFICLGDVASLGPQPHGVIKRLRQLRCAGVLGNTDEWLLEPAVAEERDPDSDRRAYRINEWCARQLTPEDLAFLRELPMHLEMDLDKDRTLLGYHGSPRSFDDVIAAVTPDAVVKDMLAGYSASVMVGGHTHSQMVRRYEESHIINVGSVGLPGVNPGVSELPLNRSVNWAEYGVLSLENGRLSIELRRTPLDMNAVKEATVRSRMPDIEWWLEKWA